MRYLTRLTADLLLLLLLLFVNSVGFVSFCLFAGVFWFHLSHLCLSLTACLATKKNPQKNDLSNPTTQSAQTMPARRWRNAKSKSFFFFLFLLFVRFSVLWRFFSLFFSSSSPCPAPPPQKMANDSCTNLLLKTQRKHTDTDAPISEKWRPEFLRGGCLFLQLYTLCNQCVRPNRSVNHDGGLGHAHL